MIPPDLAAFGLNPSSIVAVPGGYTADCYRARAAGADWFVKVWREPVPTDRLELLAVLAEAGLPVFPPRRTLSGAVADGRVAVFPYVHGTPAPDWPEWPDQRIRELGAVLAAVHRVDPPAWLPADRLLPHDYASVPWPPEFAEEVGDQVRRLSEIDVDPFRPVLAHADVKGDNVMFTAAGLVLAGLGRRDDRTGRERPGPRGRARSATAGVAAGRLPRRRVSLAAAGVLHAAPISRRRSCAGPGRRPRRVPAVGRPAVAAAGRRAGRGGALLPGGQCSAGGL